MSNRVQASTPYHPPKSPLRKNVLRAFLVGGGICALGQNLLFLYQWAGLSQKSAMSAVTVTLIFLAALVTGLGKFDDIAKFAGAGTLVPITGFANSVAAPAIEFKAEGQVFGIGCKIFTIAGPVISPITITEVELPAASVVVDLTRMEEVLSALTVEGAKFSTV